MTSEPQSAAQGRSAWRNIAALLAGPVLLVAIGFILFGDWGAIAGIFIGLAALVFIPASARCCA